MARSTLSLGIFAALAFCITARNRALVSGLGPPSLIAITMSLPILVNVFAIADQRFIFLAFLNSNALPISKYRSEEHTSELQSRENLVCRLLLEKKNNNM